MTHDANNPSRPNASRRRKRLARRSSRSRGSVIILSLFSAFLVAGMIGYVFNTGRHAQLRQQTQHAADAAAITGAGVIARSFNTVAMNNVEISRLIAVVQMLDAMPLAVEYTLLDVQAALETTDRQIQTGTGDPLGDLTLQDIARQLRSQEYWLTEMHQFFNLGSYDVREMTFYESEFGRGELWKAMETLEAISTATMEHLHELTEAASIETGTMNLPGGLENSVAAIALPPEIVVWERYEFDDFRDPVVEGKLPDWVDDEITNRGPYDTIFGWHLPDWDRDPNAGEDIELINPNSAPAREITSRPSSRWSGGMDTNRRSNWRQNHIVVGYYTYGTWRWLGHILRQHVDTEGVLYNSQFVTRVNRMAGNKLNYVWPGSVRNWDFLDPQWITSFEQAESIIEARTPRVAYTQFVRMDYEQYFVNDVPQGAERMVDWEMIRPRGGHTSVPGATKIRDHVWEDEGTLEWIETRLVENDEGEIVEIETEHRIEYRWLFVWEGINVGPEITIRDPNNFTNRTELPAPIDFNHGAIYEPGTLGEGMPYSPFFYMAIAQQPNNAPLWGSLYNTSAYDNHVAIAQVSVFNNHSWDLWTQMWHAQLEPVKLYDLQVDNLSATREDARNAIEYLESLKTLAPYMLNH